MTAVYEDDDEMGETWVRTLAKSGPWALVAAGLIWFLVSDVRADQRAFHLEHIALTSQHSELATLIRQLVLTSERTTYLQRQQCYNTAHTDELKRACSKDRD